LISLSAAGAAEWKMLMNLSIEKVSVEKVSVEKVSIRKFLVLLSLVIGLTCTTWSHTNAATGDTATEASVTILSSNLANGAAVGEWGLSALVQVDGQCILFDAGRYPDTVIRNAEVLNVDLSCVTDVVLSHFHFDHTTGLIPIIENLREINPGAIRRVHVAAGFFAPRRAVSQSAIAANQMIDERNQVEAMGVEFLVHDQATEIFPAVWVSGPVERLHSETNYGTALEVSLDGEWVRDHLPESQALVIRTDQGPIVLLGCGHSGVVNALSQIQAQIQDEAIHALMGGTAPVCSQRRDFKLDRGKPERNRGREPDGWALHRHRATDAPARRPKPEPTHGCGRGGGFPLCAGRGYLSHCYCDVAVFNSISSARESST
jgi:7,8-dihydropterin-6-yl-methyl-4-(beta-D-ribofuranosyl)aminobenzene 5'-phosphate synthase